MSRFVVLAEFDEYGKSQVALAVLRAMGATASEYGAYSDGGAAKWDEDEESRPSRLPRSIPVGGELSLSERAV